MASQARPDIKFASPGRRAVPVDLDDALLGASLAFAGAAVWGSVTAIRDQLPGQPARHHYPAVGAGRPRVGWGAGVAAPWPMPVAAGAAAVTALVRGRSEPQYRGYVLLAEEWAARHS